MAQLGRFAFQIFVQQSPISGTGDIHVEGKSRYSRGFYFWSKYKYFSSSGDINIDGIKNNFNNYASKNIALNCLKNFNLTMILSNTESLKI